MSGDHKDRKQSAEKYGAENDVLIGRERDHEGENQQGRKGNVLPGIIRPTTR
jgi:hypothetical protein